MSNILRNENDLGKLIDAGHINRIETGDIKKPLVDTLYTGIVPHSTSLAHSPPSPPPPPSALRSSAPAAPATDQAALLPPMQVVARSSHFAHQFSRQLQLQERLTHQIADEILRVTESRDVMVVGGQHLYMAMRGIRTDSIMSNSVVRGRFRDLPALRAEALSLMGSR